MAKIRDRILLIYNPYSGNGLFKNNLDLIVERIQEKGYQVVPVRTCTELPIDDVMMGAKDNHFRQVIVAGGDGTINICVNAMMKAGLNLPLGIFPIGTANDFAYYFDLPRDIESMVDVALGENYTYADLGVYNDKYFINVAALGSLVDVSQKTDPNLKNTLGVIAYYLKGITEVANLKPIPITLTTPEKVYHETMFFMVVMNGISAGGFKRMSPDSEINDGKLDVVLFRKMPIIELAPLLFQLLQGHHPKNKNILSFQTSDLKLESELDVSTDIDGEHGEKLPLKLSVLPNKLKICVPKNDI